MGLIHSENLAVSPSEFRRLSVRRLERIRDYLNKAIESIRDEDDPNYELLSSDMTNIRLSIQQMEYSFEEIAQFLENLSEKVNVIVEEKVK